MSLTIINEQYLTDIGDALRVKTETDTKYKPKEMSAAILTLGTGAEEMQETLVISDNVEYLFANNNLDNFVAKYGNCITTKNLTEANHMFYLYGNDSVPFSLNFKVDNSVVGDRKISYLFERSNIKELPQITGKVTVTDISWMYNSCMYLRHLNNSFDFINWEKSHYGGIKKGNNIFSNCYSLRSIPETALINVYTEDGGSSSNYLYMNPWSMFKNCYVLDEIKNFTGFAGGSINNNTFSETFYQCGRVKEITFSPNQNRAWTKQTIDLTKVGYAPSLNSVINYNSGITADKEVKNAATYEALKNDNDWFTLDKAYSRYNHDSAVNTINSLPNITSGSGNTIIFSKSMGSATDGGAIENLTAEEIAVATAKGWTISFAT